MPGFFNRSIKAMPVWIASDEATTITQGADYEDQRVFDGFGYTVSTSVTAVAAGSYLISELANPTGSGVNLIMTSRVMADNIVDGGAPLEYARYPSSSVISTTPTPTSVTIGNRIASGTASPATFRYNMSTTLPTGTSSSGGFVPTGGEEKRIKDIVIIPPGGKLIYAVGGSGGGLAASARIVMTFLFYTMPV